MYLFWRRETFQGQCTEIMRLCTSVSVQGECFKNPSTLPLKVKADPIILFQNALVTEKRNMSYTLLLLYHSWRIVERLTVGGIENSFAQSVVEHKHCCDTMARSINLQRLPQRRDNSIERESCWESDSFSRTIAPDCGCGSLEM